MDIEQLVERILLDMGELPIYLENNNIFDKIRYDYAKQYTGSVKDLVSLYKTFVNPDIKCFGNKYESKVWITDKKLNLLFSWSDFYKLCWYELCNVTQKDKETVLLFTIANYVTAQLYYADEILITKYLDLFKLMCSALYNEIPKLHKDGIISINECGVRPGRAYIKSTKDYGLVLVDDDSKSYRICLA